MGHDCNGSTGLARRTLDAGAGLPGRVPAYSGGGPRLPLRGWYGFHVPVGTQRPFLNRYNAELRKAYADPVYQEEFLNAQALTMNPGTPEEFDEFVGTQVREMQALIKFLGMKPE